MKQYDAYFFDWDGTIGDSHQFWTGLMREQIGRYGIELSDEEIVRQLFGRYTTGIREYGVPEADALRLTAETVAAGEAGLQNAPLFDGAAEVLQLLDDRGKRLGVITSSYRAVIDPAIKKHELAGRFDIVVGGDEVKLDKPDAEGIKYALGVLGVAPSRALMVGDSSKDLGAAKNAGVDSALFYPPSHETQHNLAELQSLNPVFTFRSWRELLEELQ